MTKPGAKYLTWFMTLVLVMACVPSLATPIPVSTLDPNAVNMYIAQTANAASTQTVEAIPESTSTATSTPAYRDTFTPEPTFTPVEPIIFISPTSAPGVQYFRVKHDSQLAMYNYKSRTADGDWNGAGKQTPEVVPLFVAPKPASGTNRTRVDGIWEFYINTLNNNDEKKLVYLKSSGTALFNTAGFPMLESLTMGGNVITLDEIQGGWGRVHTIDYNNPGSLQGMTYLTNPDLVHKFVVVAWDRNKKVTRWVNPPKGATYWPLVSSRPVWIQTERLEAFPALPMVVTGITAQKVRTNPEMNSSLTGSELSQGESATVVEYHLSGSNVWGRLRSGGWITLLLYPHYPTTWRMETLPPPPG
jgi:hypothetical protein